MSRYGLVPYGPPTLYGELLIREYDANPFTVVSNDYGTALATWSKPGGAWDYQVLVRNSNGLPLHERDGETLFTEDEPSARNSYSDTGLTQGRFYYYALFVHDTHEDIWRRAGAGQVLVAQEWGYTRTLFDLLPVVYKSTDVMTLSDAVLEDEDSFLYRFLAVFGFQLDHIRTEMETVRGLLDARTLAQEMLPSLSSQLGVQYEPEIGSRELRRLVANAVHLWGLKGTLQGVRELANIVTDYAARVRVGYNIALDDLDAGPKYGAGRWVVQTGGTVAYDTYEVDDQGPAGTGAHVFTSDAGAAVVTTPGFSYEDHVRLGFAIPIIEGLDYIVSRYVRGTGGTAASGITWLDSRGGVINSEPVYGADVTLDGTWTPRPFVTQTAPAGARYLEAVLTFTPVSVESCGFMVQEDTVLRPWQCAREILVYLEADLVNLISNTSGKTGASGYSAGATAIDVAGEPYIYYSPLASTDPGAVALFDGAGEPIDGAGTPPATQMLAYGSPMPVEAGEVWTVLSEVSCAIGPGRNASVGFELYTGSGSPGSFTQSNDVACSLEIDSYPGGGFTAADDDVEVMLPALPAGAVVTAVRVKMHATEGDHAAQWASYNNDVLFPVTFTRPGGGTAGYLPDGDGNFTVWATDPSTLTGTTFRISPTEGRTGGSPGDHVVYDRLTVERDYTVSGPALIGVSFSTPAPANGDQLSHTIRIPEGAAYDSVRWAVYFPDAHSGDSFGVRHNALEKAEADHAFFFDGSTPSNSNDFLWQGTPYASPSHYYPYRTGRSARLRDLLSDFLPYQSCFALAFAQDDDIPDTPLAVSGYDVELSDSALTPSGRSIRLRYNTYKTVGKSLGLEWDTNALAVGKSLAVDFDTYKTVGKNLELQWQVMPFAHTVGRDLELMWSVPDPTPPPPALVSSVGSTFTGSGPVALPAGLVVGQRLVIMAENIIAPGPTLSLPAGWDLLGTITYRYGNMYAWTRVVDGTEGSSVAMTNSNSGGVVTANAWAASASIVQAISAESTGFEAPYQPAAAGGRPGALVLLGGYEQGGIPTTFPPATTDYGPGVSTQVLFSHYANPAQEYRQSSALFGTPDSWVAMAVVLDTVPVSYNNVYSSTASSVVQIMAQADAQAVVTGMDTSSVVPGKLTRLSIDLKVSGNRPASPKQLAVMVYDGAPGGRLIGHSRFEGFYSDSTAGVEYRWTPTLSYIPTSNRVCVVVQPTGPGFDSYSALRSLIVDQAGASALQDAAIFAYTNTGFNAVPSKDAVAFAYTDTTI